MKKIKDIIEKYKLQSLLSVFWFCLITIVIHILWRLWAYRLHYAPIAEEMHEAGMALAWVVFEQSSWFIVHVLNMDVSLSGNVIYFTNSGSVGVNSGCSGLKPILQFVILMVIYPGPWKHKLWYIPLGVIIVHMTNLFRIIGLSVVMVNWPSYWHFSHDYLFRPFFYVMIFLMWVLWVEFFMKKKNKI